MSKNNNYGFRVAPNKRFQANVLKIKGKTKMVRKTGRKCIFKQSGAVN